MAIKGLIDNSAYVLGDYQDLGYYDPPRQTGVYMDADYVATDYFQDALTLSSAFTLSAQGIVIDVKATLTSTFSVSVSAQNFDFAF